MRCPSCNKFPSLDLGEAEGEIGSCDYDTEKGELTIYITANLKLNTVCCGDEVKEGNFEIEITHDVGKLDCKCDEFEAEVDEISGCDRYETKNPRTGKPYAPRFQKHFYGVEGKVSYSCSCGKTEGKIDFEDEMQASSMDEIA